MTNRNTQLSKEVVEFKAGEFDQRATAALQ